MGLGLAKKMEENFKKQQEFQIESQRLQLERQMMMQNLMRERQMAMQLAKARDLLLWTSGFGSLVLIMCTVEFARTKHRGFVLPLLPIMFVLGYQYDMAYGSKIERMRKEADNLLINNPGMFAMPMGPITFDEVERQRFAVTDEQRFRPNDVFL